MKRSHLIWLIWLLFACLPAYCEAQSEWPQFLGPSRNGIYAGNVAGKWPAEGPKTLWRRDAGQGFAGPVVSDGKVILFQRVEDNERVECMEAGSGKMIWTTEYPTTYRDAFGFDEGPRGTPAIAHGRIYTFGAEGKLHCWDRKDAPTI